MRTQITDDSQSARDTGLPTDQRLPGSQGGRPAPPLRVYTPAKAARKNVFEIAAANGPVQVYGVTAEGALAAPGHITFGQFIRLVSTLEKYGSRENSDATRLLLEFQDEFRGHTTRKMLTAFVKRHHSGKPLGFRYWNRIASSIWKLYQGLLHGKIWTGKAHDGEVKRLLNAAKRAGKETERSQLRRKPKTPEEVLVQQKKKRQSRQDWLRRRAANKRAAAQRLLEKAAALEAEAAAIDKQVGAAG
jgi:hypothetical protein